MWLTHLLWDTTEEEDRWHRDDATWWQDLRSRPQQGTPGPGTGDQGMILAEFPAGGDPADGIDLGDNLGSRVNPGLRASIRDFLDIDEALPGATLRAVLINLLVRMGDPTGQARWRGIRVNNRRRLQLRIGGVMIFDEACAPGHPDWNHTRDIFRSAYRQNRARVDAGIMPMEALQRYIGYEMRKYQLRAVDLLPPEFESDGSLEPRTTLGDTFVASSDETLANHTATGPNGGFTWANFADSDVLTVRATPDKAGNNAGTSGSYQVSAALSSDDQQCKVDVKYADAVQSDEVQVIIRKDPTESIETMYNVEVRQNDDRIRIGQTVTGTRTTLSTHTATAIGTTEFEIKVDMDSDDILHMFVDGVEKDSFDDQLSPIGVSNLITGLRANPAGAASNDDTLLDNWEASDLAAPAGGGIRNPFGGPMVLRNPLGA